MSMSDASSSTAIFYVFNCSIIKYRFNYKVHANNYDNIICIAS